MTMTNATLIARAQNGGVRDGDPAAKPARRRFTSEYKLAILAEYEQLTDSGSKGALLRREGLYSSHIVEWRRAREVGALAELAPTFRRSKRSAEQAEIERLRRRNTFATPDVVKAPRRVSHSSGRCACAASARACR